MKRILCALALFGSLGASIGARAGTITLTFDGLKNSEPINNYYNGGIGGFGSGPGPNYGITFTSDSLACISVLVVGGECNFSNVPAPGTNESAFFLTGAGDTMNVPAGFNTGFSFYYAAGLYPGSVSVYSGLDGTGTLLAMLTLPTNGSYCDGKTFYSCWSQIGVSFAGTAKSVIFSGSANYIGFTDITVGLAVVPSPPIPGLGSQSGNKTSAYATEPVNTGNGNYYYQHADFTISSRGLPLVFQRSYNSLGNYAGPLGANWMHTYNMVFSQYATTNANVVWIRWGDGHTETYTSSATGYVAQPGVHNALVQNPDGTFSLIQKNQTKYNFSAYGTLISIQDKNGDTTQLTYDGSGNLTTIAAAGGRTLTLAYDSSGRILSVTDSMGHVESYSYDAANELVSATDPLGGVTKYVYDGSHHVSSITLPNGNTLLENTYDSQGRTISQTNGRGFTWQFAYNTPASGQTTITDARGATAVHTYDNSLRIVTILDALGHTTSYAYDSNNNRRSATNQMGKTTNFSFDLSGNLLGIVDPLGDTTSFTYDSKNDLLTATNPKGETTRFTYDGSGNLLTIQDALGDTTTFAYDGFGELISREDARANTTTFAYDTFGDLTQITNPLGHGTTLGYDSIGRLISITDPNGQTATSAYDALSRLTMVADPLGDQTQFSYDPVGNLLKVIDANGHQTNYAYDATNNLVAVTDALRHVTRYAYDADNNRVMFTNAKGNATLYSYDALNRLIKITDPLSFVTSYAYDLVGNVVSTTDAKGQTNTFTYDALNRLLTIGYADGNNVAYSYDADGNRTSMVDSSGTTTYSYDALDRVAAITHPGPKVVTYAYDAVGNRKSLGYPDGKLVTYLFDPANRLSAVSDWLGHTTTYAYDPAGNLTSTSYPNDTVIRFAYDAANRLTQVVNSMKRIFPITFDYTLDAVGNRSTISVDGAKTKFAYDALNELLSEQLGRFKTSWTYDAVGNRLQESGPFETTAYTYDADDRMLTAGATTFSYDADGNDIAASRPFGRRPTSYHYDAANRLIGAIADRTISSFAYDGDGNRISQTVNGETYRYLNDVATPLPVVLQESQHDDDTCFVYGQALISELSRSSSNFYHYDGLGSVIALSDADGRPKYLYAYDPWGNSILRVADEATTRNPFRFTGQALDPGTQLYYFRARYYDQISGRFGSRDPLHSIPQAPLTANKYTYSLNNPTSLVDPYGLSPETPLTNSANLFLLPVASTLNNAGTTISIVPNATPSAQSPPSANAPRKSTCFIEVNMPAGTDIGLDFLGIGLGIYGLILEGPAGALEPYGPLPTGPQGQGYLVPVPCTTGYIT